MFRSCDGIGIMDTKSTYLKSLYIKELVENLKNKVTRSKHNNYDGGGEYVHVTKIILQLQLELLCSTAYNYCVIFGSNDKTIFQFFFVLNYQTPLGSHIVTPYSL